jgi:hypothetical protein
MLAGALPVLHLWSDYSVASLGLIFPMKVR